MTPIDIFFSGKDGKFAILSVNFFDVDGVEEGSFVNSFRKSVATWFYAMRLISSVILLCILIYVGIRMALSSVAEDRARYKKMLVDWVCSLALIFLLQYIALAVIYTNDAIVNALYRLYEMLNLGEGANIDDFMGSLALNSIVGVGIPSLVSVFVYCGIIAQTIFFFIAYVNRMLKVGFLIIISPLISITYSIDKMGDGKAQALNNWLKEFIYTILIQPFHCIMYIALVNTSFKLIESTSAVLSGLPALVSSLEFNQMATGVLAILCLKFINDGEQVVRKIFGFSDDNSKTSMAAGAIAGMALLSNAKKIGGSTRKGINTARNAFRNFGTAVSTDKSKLKDFIGSKNLGKDALGKATDKAKDMALGGADKKGSGGVPIGKEGKPSTQRESKRTIKDKAKTSEGGTAKKGTFRNAANFAAKQLRKNMPRALGMMAMAMAYSTGTTSLLEANAMRVGITEGSQEFFGSSASNLADSEKDNMQALEDADFEALEDGIEKAKSDIKDLGFGEDITAEEASNLANSDNAKAAQEAAKAAAEKSEKVATQLALATKRNEAAKAALESAKKELEKNGSKSRKKRKEAKEKVRNAEKELEKTKTDLENVQKGYDRAKGAEEKAKDEAARYQALQSAVQRRDALQAAKDNFYTEAAIKQRIAQRASGPSNSELEKKKNEILQLILQLKKQQSYGGEEDSVQDNLITEDDTDSAIRTTDNIVKRIDLAVLKGGAVGSARDMIMDKTGLNSRSSSTLDSLDKAIKDYESLRRAASISQTFSKHASYEGDSDVLINKMYKNLRKSGASKG